MLAQELKLDETDFESGQDSSILVRERSRGTKLDRAFKKREGVLLEQSNHRITFLPAGKKLPTVISKRDIEKTVELANKLCCSREAAKQNWRDVNEVANPSELSGSIDRTKEFESANSLTKETPPKQTTLSTQQKKTPAIIELKKNVKRAKEGRRTLGMTKQTKQPTIFEIESDSEEEQYTQV